MQINQGNGIPFGQAERAGGQEPGGKGSEQGLDDQKNLFPRHRFPSFVSLPFRSFFLPSSDPAIIYQSPGGNNCVFRGRPIILAGFSQGAVMCYRLLAEYFGDEELYGQLVCVYAFGWPLTEELVSEYPQMVPATGPDDVGTIVSFDCEAPELEETFINPIGQKA